MSTLAKLDAIPPKLCRIVATSTRGYPISQEGLAKRIGWSKTKVIRVSRLDSWATLSLKDCEAWAKACGLELCRLKEMFYLRLRRMKTIYKNLRANQRQMYDRLLPK